MMRTIAPATEQTSIPTSRSHRSLRRLWLYGVGILVPALYFAWRYPLPGNTDRLTDIGKMSDYGSLDLILFLAGIGLMYGSYILALFESRHLDAERAIRSVFGIAAVLGLVMLFLYPVNAIDIFIYAVRSRLFTEYGANPIAVMPDAVPGDAWMRFSGGWDDHVSPYGPLWNLVAAPFTLVAGDDLAVALYGFKVLALLSFLGTGWVISRILAQTAPTVAAAGSLLFLWNPLVLWEGIGNGHNDLLLTLVLLLAVLAWVRHWDRWVVPILILGALIKYVTILLLPLAALALWRRTEGSAQRLRLAVWSGLLSLGASASALAPFYDVPAVWESVRAQGDIVLSSPLSLAMRLPSLREHFEQDEIKQWGKRIGEGLFLVAFAVLALALWARPSRFPRISFEVLYAFLLFATWNFRGWYLIWPVGLAALFPFGWPAWRIIAWTAGALAGYSVFIWMQTWWWEGEPAKTLKAGVAMIFLPTMLLTLVEVVLLIRRRASSIQRVVLSRTGADA